MRKLFILILIANGLSGLSYGQGFLKMNFTQPPALTAIAGQDTLVCAGHPVILGGVPTATGGTGDYLYMWSPPDGLDDPTSANPVATLTESKSYMLSVTDERGCMAVGFISVYANPCLGINQNEISRPITVFPNPSDGIFIIQGLGSQSGKVLKIEVFNQLGQAVFSRNCNPGDLIADYELDTRIEEPGVYYLKISLSDRLFSQRLIVR